MRYSPSTGGFYTPEIHGDAIPEDAIAVTDQEHADLIAGTSAGKSIVVQGGVPTLVDPPAPSDEELAAAARAQRNRLLRGTDWTALPDVPLTDAERAAWTDYRQSLRDVTAQAGFPSTIDWPALPA